eukprot:TRINITY_DN1709_c0_g1_i3.p1 TRINITY_DN1709_c0_g1~~TRINITY_DN1709_c0_g1_i3.p1  ORF type:complete len:882 (+),score=155.82 TRINITY_DN1709_c0_g1_i3:330-2975(+)
MQARENTGPSLMNRKVAELLYPGHCGYSSETGGIMADLRRLTAQQVRDYHKSYYRPDNLCLIVAGKVDPAHIFETLKPVEAKIVSKGELPKMKRPWSSPVPPFTETQQVTITFPSEDEDSGSAAVAWRGPACDNFETASALRLLWKYLTDSSVSPVLKSMVDIPDPFASDVSFNFYENSVFLQVLKFNGVPTSKLSQLQDKFFEVIKNVVADGLDMDRMASVINRTRLKYLSSLETGPHEKIAFIFISDFLYGKDGELEAAFSEVKRYEALLAKDSQFWIDLLKRNLLDQPFAFVLGSPSKEKAKQIADTDAARIAAQKEALGEARLVELEEALEKAIESNDVEIPAEELEKIPIPNASKIPSIPVATYRNLPSSSDNSPQLTALLKKSANVESEGDIVTPPFFIQLDNVPSVFVELTAYIDTEAVPDRLRPYIELYNKILFEIPVRKDDGQVIGHEEVVKQLVADTVGYSSTIGFGGGSFACGTFAQLIQVHLKTEVSKYKRGIELLKDLLWNTQFTKDRVEINVQKLLNEVPSVKRRGMEMVFADSRLFSFDSAHSNHPVSNLVRQQVFLTDVLKRLQDESKQQSVLDELEEFRKALCHPQNIRIQAAGNFIDNLSDPMSPWLNTFLPERFRTDKKYVDTLSPVKFSSEFRTDSVKNNSSEKVTDILSMAAIESSYLAQFYPGPTSYADEDISPLHVLIEYLTTMEGPFWKRIRGCGLAYSYGIRLKVEQGLLYFILFKSVSLVKAYEEARNIILQFANNEVQFEETGLAAARSSTIFSVISREETAASAITQSLVNYFRGAGSNESQRILANIAKVRVEDLQRVLVKYFVPLFDPAVTNVVAAVPPAFADDTRNHFVTKYNKKANVVESLDAHFGAQH